MSETMSRYSGVGIVASLVFHAALFWALGKVPRGTLEPSLSSMVDFEVKAKEPQAEPPPDPDPEPVEEAREPSQPAPREPAEPEPQEEAEPDPPEIADLTGLTLTNAGEGSGWASAVGNGAAMERPIRAGIVRAKSVPRDPIETPKPAIPAPKKATAPAVVPARDLSKKPVPPDLNGVLEAHYPKSAREMGLEGTAIVRLRIDPDGRVRLANIVSESGAGFGSACRRTVLGSNWSAPLDQAGNSVATFVKYTCRFRVNQ